MTFIMLDMICSPRDLALSSLLICNHYYLHHHLQFLLVGWDICHTGLVKEMNAVSGQREKVTHGNRSGFEYSQKSPEGIIRLQAGVCDSAGAWIQKVPEQKHQGHTGGGGQLILCPQLAQSDKVFKDTWERKSVLGGSTADVLPCFRAAAAGRWSSCSCSKEPGFPGKVSIRQSKWGRGRHGLPAWETPLHSVRKLI